MNFIDTHSHLYSSKFDNDREQVVKDAIKSGVSKILLPNISSSYTEKMLDLCNLFPNNCFPMMGLHPCDVKADSYNTELKHVEHELETKKYIAVGETGIDLYWDKSTIKLQKKCFIFHVKLAKKYKIPIVIHVRESFDHVIEIIEDLNDDNLCGVFHCFSGNVEEANRIINLNNFYLGIGGVLTFKNSTLKDTIEKVDIKHLILETDAPYLSPTPFRGKRNESKYLVSIAEHLAQTMNLSIEEIAKHTTNNAKKLFSL